MPHINGQSLGLPGKLIALYGINRLGKTTQTEMLAERIREQGQAVMTFKYPRYDLEPTGPRINAYLREGNPENLTPKEFQILNVENRTDFQDTLLAYLETGHVIVEDYWGTGVAWGMTAGVDADFLIDRNGHLIKEDLAILFDGTAFTTGAEENHTHEGSRALLLSARETHLKLQVRFGWKVVKTNDTTREGVHSCVWSLVGPLLRPVPFRTASS